MSWTPPEELEEYRIVKPLGRGGMGQVFLARDTLLERLVAMKFIADVDPSATTRARFLVEARAAARLQHPNVVAVYRVGEVDGRPFLISELLHGESLAELAKPVAPAALLPLAVGLARGLAAAHQAGVLHRDIKPANAFLSSDGTPKLLDFGLAKLLDTPSLARDPLRASPRAREPRPLALADTDGRDGATGGARSENGTIDQTRTFAGFNPPLALPAVASNDGRPSSPTLVGAIMGTPLYMAPEAWRGEPANPATDVYGLGCVLYELATGSPPHRGRSVQEVMTAATRGARPIRQLVPALDPRLAAIIDQCLEADPAARFRSGTELRTALEHLQQVSRGNVPTGNPYRGLQRFEPQHRALFFGRTREVDAVVERLRSERFVLVAGDSGVGKSSLCRAGVVPAVGDGALGEGRTWTIASMVPGRHPLVALRAALEPIMASGDELDPSLDPLAFLRSLHRELASEHGLLLLLDQMEELVTLSTPDEARALAGLLDEVAQGSPGLRVLATARSDFLTRLTTLPAIGDRIAGSLYLLRPLSRDGIREAIIGPAAENGVRFESEELVETLVASASGTDGGLPLLQFALAEIWEARDRQRSVITAAALDDIGGVTGALARHADAVLAGMLPAQRIAARRAMLALVTAEGTRGLRTEDELVETIGSDVREALASLVRGRLLIARDADAGVATYEVAHEALLTGWGTLHAWIEHSAENRIARQRVENAALEWERLGRKSEGLWSSRQLQDIAAVDADDLVGRARAFVEASRRAVRRRRRAVLAVAAVVPLALGLGYFAFGAQAAAKLASQLEQRIAAADERYARARVRRAELATLHAAAMRAFDKNAIDEAETQWARRQELVDELERAYAEVGHVLESGLSLSPRDARLRARLARLLGDSITLAEDYRRHRPEPLYARLELYDDDGAITRAMRAPATVKLASRPPAEVRIERYRPKQDGSLAPELVETVSTPRRLELAPGSYRFVLRSPDRVVVNYPVLLERAEELAIELHVPARADVPRGFVYIPAGTFLFGSSDETIRRPYLGTVPLHDVELGAYVIAQHETTFREWIEFLEALPPSDRDRYLPRPEILEFRGKLGLRNDGATWTLALKPSEQTYTARFGEPIRYPGRKARATQDWLNMPVSLISGVDAQHYARWLDESGRLPGARLCTELEWERAARGADARVYPHGNVLLPEDANYDATYARDPLAVGLDEVGSHPRSRSPFGVDDLVGNVWEFTTPAAPENAWGVGGFTAGKGEQLVARGGGFLFDRATAMAVNRSWLHASFRDMNLGIRICASYPLRR